MGEKGLLTDYKVRIELISNGHHDLLESIHVVGVAHAFLGPRDVNIS